MKRKTFIIAEAGVNHNGSLSLAKELVDVAKEASADAVKFQTFKAEKLASIYAPKAKYQIETTGESESQIDMLKKLELTEEMHEELIAYCSKQKIQFLSTGFDVESVEILSQKYNLPYLKVPSGEITNAPLLHTVARQNKPIILSTGMSTLGEIEQALMILAHGFNYSHPPSSFLECEKSFFDLNSQEILKQQVALLHCVSEYPAPFSAVNLNVLETLRSNFQLKVGFSDHTQGIFVALAAVAKGAEIIEKHFTLDKSLPGPDHKASLNPVELKEMVLGIEAVEQSLGSSQKIPSQVEESNRSIVRKSLVASQDIKKGESFSSQNLTTKRPGTGISPLKFWDFIGKEASKNYHKDELIQE